MDGPPAKSGRIGDSGSGVTQQALVIRLLSDLVRTPAPELDAAVNRVLQQLGELSGADRAYVFRFRNDLVMDNTHEWVADGVEPMIELLQEQPTSVLDNWRAVLDKDQTVHIPSVRDLPDTSPEKPMLEMQAILSVVSVPILVDGRLMGLAGLDRTRSEAPFSDEVIQTLRAVADMIQSALMRKDALQDLERTKHKLELTLAALPDLLLEVDHQGVYRGLHHTRALGWAPDPRSVLGHRLEEILRPEIAAERRSMMEAARNGQPVTGVEQLLRPDDPSSWVEVSVSLREGIGGEDQGGFLFFIRDISERKIREAELAEAQAALRSTSDERDAVAARLNELSAISDDWIWEQDAERRFTFLSPNVARYGLEPAFFIGRTRDEVAAVLNMDTEDPGWKAITAKMAAREPFRNIVLKARKLDGGTAYFRYSGSPLFDAAGVFKGYRGVGSDVTALRERETEALETTGRIEAILAAVPDLLFEIDAHGRYTGFIAGPQHLRFPTEGPLAGRSLEEVLPAQTAAVGRAALEQVLAEGRIDGVRYPLDIDGKRHIFEISGARKEASTPEGMPSVIFLVRDATADTRQREELLKMGKIVETMTNLVVVVDRDQRIQWFNRAYAEKSGWSLEEVRGQLFEELVRTPESDPATAKALRDAIARREPFRGQTVNRDRHGNRYWIDFNVQPLFGIDGELQGYVTVETDITEHRQQQTEMSRLAAEAMAMRQRLENALDALPDTVVVFDSDNRLVIANKVYREMFPELRDMLTEGATLSSILRAGLTRNVLPGGGADADIEAVLAKRLELYAQPSFLDEVQLPNGRWVRRINNRTSDGGCITVAIDVTARRQQIEALDAANAELTAALIARDKVQEQLTKVMEGAAIGTWEWNAVTSTLTVGGQWREILGYDAAAMPPLDLSSFRKLVHPDDLNVFDTIGQVREDNATALTETEFRMRHRDGHWIWVLSRSQITRFAPDGRPEILGGVHLNISDRKRLEQDLESGRNFLQQVMDASIAAIVVMDGDGQIIYANSEGERILRLTRAELIGLTYNAPRWRSVHLDGTPIKDEDLPFARAIAEGKALRDVRFAIHWEDGTRRSLSVNALAFKENDDKLRVVTSFNDITDELAATTRLENARAQAEEASRSKSMFLANMSHEIRTPLNGVLGMAEVLEGSLTEDRQKRMIHTIRTSGETLLSILNDILDMSKIEAGKMEIERVPFVVNDMVHQVQALNAIRAEEKGLEFRVHTSSNCTIPLLGDPHRISQILNNLLHNAIKFTESGSVILTLRYDAEDGLEIQVSDTGIGMSQVQISRILDSFEQADGSITRRFGGTGLGMSIVRQLVNLMDGDITVDSELGKGTSIRVSLPLRAAVGTVATRADLPAAGDGDAALPRLAHLHALVADDSPTNLLVITEMLTESGMRITKVENGQDAVDNWRAHLERGEAFDIVLMDISMPVMDGVSALTEIRKQEDARGLPPVPVIAVTANAMPHQVADYLIAGFDTHLAKPFKQAELLHAITMLTQS